ncbi:hypothetical protein C8Q79DRAFT_596092 [Trametes meyenii]|nr:hypothetical protein C8Q79DRAFT_596092 [Trametes meyenii]
MSTASPGARRRTVTVRPGARATPPTGGRVVTSPIYPFPGNMHSTGLPPPTVAPAGAVQRPRSSGRRGRLGLAEMVSAAQDARAITNQPTLNLRGCRPLLQLRRGTGMLPCPFLMYACFICDYDGIVMGCIGMLTRSTVA